MTGDPGPLPRPRTLWPAGRSDAPPLIFAVGSGRPAKLRGVAGALHRVYPTRPLVIRHRDGSEERIAARDPAPPGDRPGRIDVRAWPTELQDRSVGVDAEPVGYEETKRCALLRLNWMKLEHPWKTANGLIVVESGRLPRGMESVRTPDDPPDPVRDVRDDVAVIAIEGRNGQQRVFYSQGTWIPIIVNGPGVATDPVDAARLKREERERRRREGGPSWTAEDQAQIESGWHVREALGVDHDRSGSSWQSYIGPRTPREELIEEAIVRHWDHSLIDPGTPLGLTSDRVRRPPEPDELGF